MKVCGCRNVITESGEIYYACKFYRMKLKNCGKRIMENMSQNKIKVKMTRAEAIALLQKHCPVDDPAAIVDFYIEARMLEVVEESPLEGLPFGFKFPYDKRLDWAACCKALYDQGWDIIKR